MTTKTIRFQCTIDNTPYQLGFSAMGDLMTNEDLAAAHYDLGDELLDHMVERLYSANVGDVIQYEDDELNAEFVVTAIFQ